MTHEEALKTMRGFDPREKVAQVVRDAARRRARERARAIRLRREHGRERGPGRKDAPSLRLEVEA